MVKYENKDPLMLARLLPNKSVALILAGGRGTRLKDLTDKRAKPAVHFGGKYRIIDFALSNCLNSGIRRIGVITQYQSHSLVQHIQRGWSFLNEEMNEFVDLLPAQQRNSSEQWYRGTADAVYQNLDIIRRYNAEYIVILAGDHIYKMDYSRMLIDHVEKGAQCTVACIPVPIKEATEFGVMEVDEDYQITAFFEKPDDPPAMPGRPDTALASMGIYVFNADYLFKLLEEDRNTPESTHDFGKDLIPKLTEQRVAYAHPFDLSCVTSNSELPPYWRDVGTLDAYWRTNLDLASVTPELDMYDRSWPIRTHMEPLPPAKFVQDRSGSHGMTMNSLVSGGCIVSGSVVVHSVLFPRVRVNSFCTIDSSVLLPDVHIGRSCRLRRCIIDRACHIPEGMVIGENADEDSARFYRSEGGVVLVTREMLAKLAEK
ncbi:MULTISPECIES: glucose-1-phosphate adenylyltransferase [Yersinia]|uniref:glucose-1-phosphate adenylyltransferase n=1 Tax=Yersinia TaxID=629 RepID=UPI0005DBD5E5|nr:MULTISPECIES: glucose-1-phosphate adenylyltransferase [Yersinia]OVZ96841.1 glucose-1-phosphate adenylyltransferase [Yersinia frederiksenii]RXA95894.1 glucose-1-phosphate adenylyltransferase [Yersinia sp. 2105 StPb PI]CNI35612.1 glucose-1-phosphate adenylyltransferase [Yersinia frederiksenii]CNI57465.1 glucose-1-phosphate adenylyltransferase [Yersinia frederiksenii]CNK35550.1 glucose-1-phosphate adenylyltransferase [Yersinia frederiksenii]